MPGCCSAISELWYLYLRRGKNLIQELNSENPDPFLMQHIRQLQEKKIWSLEVSDEMIEKFLPNLDMSALSDLTCYLIPTRENIFFSSLSYSKIILFTPISPPIITIPLL